jgi:hypothetical protein
MANKSKRRRQRKQLTDVVFLRMLDIAGFGLTITCLLLSLGFVLIEAVDSLLRK